jgi:hypothetical protein
MKKKIIASVVAALLSTTALADNVIIQNEYVKAGVNETEGTFGSGGGTRPGLQYDSTGTGTFPGDSEQGDYLTPGSPFDGFTVDVDGTAYTNNNSHGGSGIASNGWTGTPTADSATWSGGVTGVFDMTNTYSLPSGQEYIDITTGITAQTAITTLRFGRFIDPDAMPAAGDTSATDNVLGYGTIPEANVVFSEATVSRYALGLYSTDSNVGAGISSGWSTDPNDYATGGDYAVGNGDDTIGLGWEWTGLAAGDIVTANYAYIFGPSAFDAADTAITGGAGGGVDITTGTLVDVGSATDAATSAPAPAAPTVVGSASSSVTTHSSTTADGVQTIARETSTSTWDVYSDASLGTPVVAITDPGSFTGRVDQIATAQDVVGSSLRYLNFDNIEGIRMNSQMNNGMSGSTSGVVVGGSKTADNGVTISGGFTRMGTNLSGNDDTVKADTDVVAAGVEKDNVKVEVRHAMTDYTVSRTIGDFANSSDTNGTDTSASITYSPDTGKVQPVIGYTRGKRTMDGYEEAGSIQSARTVADTDDMYGYGTIGLRGDLGLVDFTAMHHTDGVNDISLGLEKDTGNVTWRIEGTRSMTDLGNTNAVSAGLVWKF